MFVLSTQRAETLESLKGSEGLDIHLNHRERKDFGRFEGVEYSSTNRDRRDFGGLKGLDFGGLEGFGYSSYSQNERSVWRM